MVVNKPACSMSTSRKPASQRCLEFCEAVIRKNPDHWLWSYKRWRARPHPELGRFPAYSRQYGV
jgi:lauroyl/myristoyl acyltransferase